MEVRDLPDDDSILRDSDMPPPSPQDQARAGLQALASLMNALKGMPTALAAMTVYQVSF